MSYLLILKYLVTASIIVFASWLSQKKPELAGFIIALPLASLIALALGHLQHGNSEASIVFARSILIGVPVSYLFFVPFFLPAAGKYGFWSLYMTGVVLLGCGYLIHRQIIAWLN